MSFPAYYTLLSLLYLASFNVVDPCAICAAYLNFALFCHMTILLVVKALSEMKCLIEGVTSVKLQAYQKALVYQCIHCLHVSKLQDQGELNLRVC